MDVRDGRMYKSIKDVPIGELPYCVEMAVPATPQQIKEGKIRRNDKCPCGSNKKFKNCCKRDFDE